MVHFPSREIKDYREVPGDLPQDWKGWEKGEQPMTAWARPFEPDAVQYRLRQGKFFSDDYLTITGTSGNLNRVGKLLSQAHTLERALRDSHEAHAPGIEEGVPFYKFLNYLRKNGFDQEYAVTHVQVGNLGYEGTIAGVIPYCNRKFIIGVSENLEQMLAAEGERTSTTRAAQWEYSILHETAHLCQRIGVYTYKTEEQVDAAVAGYASFVLQQLATAKNISEKRRLKLMRHWRQVRKIAEERRANAKRNYAYLSNGYTRSTYKKAEKKKSAKPSAAKARKAA